MKYALFPAFLAAIALSACSSLPEGEFPSLAKRPYEDQAANTDVQNPPPPLPESLPQALSARIAALETRVNAADRAFQALLPATSAKAMAASGAAESSDVWIDANIALSRLDRARADAVAAMAEMDSLLLQQLDAGLVGGNEGYAPLMKPAQQRMAAVVSAQNAAIDRLFVQIG